MKDRIKRKKLKEYIKKEVFEKVNLYFNIDKKSIYMDISYGMVNCSFRIKELPDFKIGIWYYKGRNTKKYKMDIFGELNYFIDKFKPGRCIDFKSLDHLFLFLGRAINNFDEVFKEMYFLGSNEEDFAEYINTQKQYEINSRYFSGFSPEEYKKYRNGIMDFINSLDYEDKIDLVIVDLEDTSFRNLYSIWYYPLVSCPDEYIDSIEKAIMSFKCFSFQWNKFKFNKYTKKELKNNIRMFSRDFKNKKAHRIWKMYY